MSNIEDIPYEHYPDSVVDLINIFGLPATMRFIDEFGGLTQLYVPKKITPDHPISKAVGHDAAVKLSEQYGGDSVRNIPLCKDGLRRLRDIEICRRRNGGALPKNLARDYGMTERAIWLVLARTNDAGNKNQLDIFN